MKVGDLVELSAYGKKLKCFKAFTGEIGILLTPNLVMWSNLDSRVSLVNRKDIKKIRNRNL